MRAGGYYAFGRERYCEARLERLAEVADWVEQYRKMWTERFDNLENFLDDLETKKRKTGMASEMSE